MVKVNIDVSEDYSKNLEPLLYISRANYAGSNTGKFPSLGIIQSHLNIRINKHQIMPEFISAVKEALSEVLIIDEYIFKPYSDLSEEEQCCGQVFLATDLCTFCQ